MVINEQEVILMALGVTATSANLRIEPKLSAALAATPTLYKGDKVTQLGYDNTSPDGPWHKVQCTYSNPATPGNRVGAQGWSQYKWYGEV